MPIVWDPETGKYSAKKATQAERSNASSPVSPPQSSFLESMADENIDIAQVMQLQDAMLQMAEEVSGGKGDASAALKTAISASEHQRKRAEIAEARCGRLQEAIQTLEEQVQSAARNSGLEMTLASKSREIGELQAAFAKSKQENRQLLENATREARESLASQKSDSEKALKEQKEKFDQALAAAQTEATQQLMKGLAEEKEKAQKVLEQKVAEMAEAHESQLEELRAQHKRQDAELKRGHTKEMAELLAALSKPDRNTKKGNSEAAASKSNKVVNKAKLRVESWEIANLGRQMIELMHMLLERLERLVLIADQTRSGAGRSTSTGHEDVAAALQMQARIVYEDLLAARDQVYAQLYSQDNLLGFHYMRNYPMRDQNAPSADMLAKLDLTQDLSNAISC